MGNAMRLAALAAVLVVAVAGLNFLLPGNGGFGSLQASPSPAPTPRGTLLVGDPVVLEPGTYVTDSEFLVQATLTVPAGWDGHLGGPYLMDVGRLYGPGSVAIAIFDKVYADPCQFDRGLMVPAPGPTVADLATALTSRPGLAATAPTDVTMGGYAGKQFTITAPADFDGCTLGPEGYSIWELPLGAIFTMLPEQSDRIWNPRRRGPTDRHRRLGDAGPDRGRQGRRPGDPRLHPPCPTPLGQPICSTESLITKG